MKLSKEKLASWSFPIFVIMLIVGVLLFFGVKWGVGKYKDHNMNRTYVVNGNGYEVIFPCKAINKSNIKSDYYSCAHDSIEYSLNQSFKTQDTIYETNECKKPEGVVQTTPNEDYMYKRTYNGHEAHICVYLSNTDTGINTGYGYVTASVDTEKAIYKFRVDGPVAKHDIYSSKIESVLSTFSLK